jgi:hypothetical protein
MSQQDFESRRAWRIRGQLQDYQIVRCFDLVEKDAEKRVPSTYILAELDRWLSSVYSRNIAHQLHELVTGARLDGCVSSPPRESAERIKRRLAEAFRSGELVALALGPLRVKTSGGGGGTSSSSAPAPVAVPLLADKPAPRNATRKEAPRDDGKQKEKTWVAFEVLDEKGKPLAGARYRLTLPDGSSREGRLDSRGATRVEGITEGQCVLSLPDLEG